MRNAGLEEAQAGIKIAGRNTNNLRYADDTTLMAESEEELKSLLMKVKEEWKSWLKAQHLENKDHGIWSHHFMGNRWGNSGNSVRLYFGGSKITADGDCSHEFKRRLLLGRKVMINLDSILKSRCITLPTKVHLVKAMVFPVVMYGCELDCVESWVPKNWCFWTVVLEKTLESPLDCKQIQPVHPEGQSWVFIGRTDAEADTPILWPPHAKSWLIGKDPDAGRDWRQEKKGTTEDEMAGWHHRLNGHEFEWTPGVGDGQGGLACCDSWGRRVGHDWATELNSVQLNWTSRTETWLPRSLLGY